MKRHFWFALSIFLAFFAGMWFAEPLLHPEPGAGNTAAPVTRSAARIEQPANLLALIGSAAAAPSSWPELCTLNYNPANARIVRLFCAPGVLTVPSATPTNATQPTATLIPTNTPRPTATKVPTKTNTPEMEPSPTLDDEPQPTPIPGDEPNCDVKTNQSGIALRLGHSATSQLIDRLTLGQSLKVFEFWSSGSNAWARIYDPIHSEAWFMVRSAGTWWIDVVGDLDWCGDVPGWNDTWTPGTIYNPAGLHVLGFSVNTWAVLSEIKSFGLLKAVDDFAFLASEAKRLNPRLITIHRNVHLVEIGRRDCPDSWGRGDPVMVARDWWRIQHETWKARGLLEPGPVDYYEYRNECGHAGAWEVAFDREIVRLANEAGMCLAVLSYAYGQPELDQFAALAPLFDDILERPCQPGKQHLIALHTYGRIDSGAWIFGRWRLFRQALGPKYNNLQFIFTEMGITNAQGNADGRGTADCGIAAKEAAELTAEFHKFPEIVGYNLYSVGGSTEWLDLTSCLNQIAAALQ
jgi:hypothetical protein